MLEWLAPLGGWGCWMPWGWWCVPHRETLYRACNVEYGSCITAAGRGHKVIDIVWVKGNLLESINSREQWESLAVSHPDSPGLGGLSTPQSFICICIRSVSVCVAIKLLLLFVHCLHCILLFLSWRCTLTLYFAKIWIGTEMAYVRLWICNFLAWRVNLYNITSKVGLSQIDNVIIIIVVFMRDVHSIMCVRQPKLKLCKRVEIK